MSLNESIIENIKNSIGSTGEDIACGYLENKGYKIIDRNYRTKFGEIDVISKSPNKTLVFCEVKTMKYKPIDNNFNENMWKSYSQKSGNNVDKLGKVWQGLAKYDDIKNKNLLKPEDQFTYSKSKKFKKIAEWYANNNLDKLRCKGFRLDLIAIDLYNSRADVRWYKNVI